MPRWTTVVPELALFLVRLWFIAVFSTERLTCFVSRCVCDWKSINCKLSKNSKGYTVRISMKADLLVVLFLQTTFVYSRAAK